MTGLSAADLIRQQIQIQFTAIIRFQQIMWVEDKDELIKEIKKAETYSDANSTLEKQEWEFQFAWERQAAFLNAQSRAMAELRDFLFDWSTKFQFLVGGYGSSKSYHVALKIILKLLRRKTNGFDCP